MKEVNKEITLFKKYIRKVKLKKVYELLDVTPNAYQAEFIDDWDNHFHEIHTFTSTLGRRAGKSFSAGMLVATHLQVPYASVALIAPNMKLTEIVWNEVITTLQKLGIKPTKINTQSKSLTMENGAKLQAGSIQSPEAMVGRRFSLVLADESCLDNDIEEMLNHQVLPATTDFGLIPDTDIPYSKLLFYSSPRGKIGMHYNSHVKGKAKLHGYKSYQYASTVNPMVTTKFLDGMRDKMDDLTFRQEYLAEFVDTEGNTAVHSFDEKKNLFSFDKIKPFLSDMVIISGIDIGFTDSSAQVLVAKSKDEYYCFDATKISQTDTKSVYELFKSRETTYNITPEVRYIDKSAALTAHDFAVLYSFVTFPGVNDRKIGISILNQLFREGKLHIEETLYDLIQEINTLKWQESGKDFIRMKTHHHDLIHALRYVITSDYQQYGNMEVIVL